MANITTIVSGSLPQQAKNHILHSKPLSEIESDYDDVYVLRVLIEKVNELVAEVNKLNN